MSEHLTKFRRRPLAWHKAPGIFWFRIFGKGLLIRDSDQHPPMFSERNGYMQFWIVKVLR